GRPPRRTRCSRSSGALRSVGSFQNSPEMIGERMRKSLLLPALLFSAALASASIFGVVRGIVHDPQHRPIAGAAVTLKAADSDWSRTMETNGDGEFILTPVPLGDYTITVSQPGFADP